MLMLLLLLLLLLLLVLLLLLRAFVYHAIRGLGRTKALTRRCPPSCRK